MLEPVGHLAGRPLEVRDHIEFEIIVNRALAPDRAAHLSLPRTFEQIKERVTVGW